MLIDLSPPRGIGTRGSGSAVKCGKAGNNAALGKRPYVNEGKCPYVNDNPMLLPTDSGFTRQEPRNASDRNA